MSFRGRLRLFFTIIVIVPMIAVAVVLFSLSEQSATGKADAGIAAGLRTAISVYRDASDRAEPQLRAAAGDPQLRSAISAGRAPAARSPCAIWASALPVSLSAVMLKRTSATAIIGTITMIMKKSSSRLRKLTSGP